MKSQDSNKSPKIPVLQLSNQVITEKTHEDDNQKEENIIRETLGQLMLGKRTLSNPHPISWIRSIHNLARPPGPGDSSKNVLRMVEEALMSVASTF